MKIVIISGSHRAESESARVASFLADKLRRHWDDAVHLRDLGTDPLPLWDEGVWARTAEWEEHLAPLVRELEAADAIVVVTPEWGGMATPAIKNFLLLCPSAAVGHKPALLVTVSHSRGGAYPVAELRMSGYKNNHLCFIPEHIIVRDAADALQEGAPSDDSDAYLRGRVEYALALLREYGRALKGVRQSGVIDRARFPYGM